MLLNPIIYITILTTIPRIISTKSTDVNVLITEVFEIVLRPELFNWTYDNVEGPQGFLYQAKLLASPDLPTWINYVPNTKHWSGHLYGVPPTDYKNHKIQLEVVGLNLKDYETRQHQINIIITDKLNPALYEVHMKIVNLNVEDVFDAKQMTPLKNVFRKYLWTNSENDLYLTFLASAVNLGARKPLNPTEPEGVVLRLGSREPFSGALIELQDEVKPLWKVASCPFKRTSVEIFFRDVGFTMDWCAFRLITGETHRYNDLTDLNGEIEEDDEEKFSDRWESVSRDDLPERTYIFEFTYMVLVPTLILVIILLILSIILCLHNDVFDDDGEAIGELDGDFSTVQRTTQTSKNLSTNQRKLNLSPDPILLSRSHTISPTSTISRGIHCRPSPPPYVRPKLKPDL